jgi:Na+-driven multidrug efflux pump
MDILTASITIILSIPLIRIMNIEGAAISYLIANIIGALIVISRIKNPKELTIRLLNDIKNNVSYNF